MIFDGTLDRFPRLKFCGAHAGGYLPSYLGRTDVTCDSRANANCANKKHPREYFKGQVLADSMVFSEEGLRHLVAEMGAGQVAYGTDIPFNWPAPVDLVLKATFLKDTEKEAILGGNVAPCPTCRTCPPRLTCLTCAFVGRIPPVSVPWKSCWPLPGRAPRYRGVHSCP
jgi:aminocarboxymuconate-semialdehyde decarboxylase